MTKEEIKQLRKKLGLKQEHFGKILGYANPIVRVCEIETGTVPISLRTQLLCKQIKWLSTNHPEIIAAIVESL